MKNRLMIIVIAPLLLLMSGCATYYKEAGRKETSATIEAEGYSAIPFAELAKPPKVYMYAINGLPLNKFTGSSSAPRRIQAGTNIITFSANIAEGLTATGSVSFVAEAEKRYFASFTDWNTHVTLEVYDAATREVVGSIRAEKYKKEDPIYFPIYL